MATVNIQTVPHASNGAAEFQQLEAIVRDLKAECDKLREELAKAETERDAYRHLFLEEARKSREFEDLDIPALEGMSAGLVEMLNSDEGTKCQR